MSDSRKLDEARTKNMGQRNPYPRWQLRHEGVLLWLLEHPAAKLKDCAAATGYTPSHISRIVNSPDFQVRFKAALQSARKERAERILHGWRKSEHDEGHNQSGTLSN